MAAFWVSSAGGDIGRGATEDAGDSFERLTEAEDMRDKWGMLRPLAIWVLLSLHWGFSGDIPELVVVHVPVWQVPKCCHSLDSLSTSGDTGAVDVAHDVGGYGWTPPCILLHPQLDQGVVANSLVLVPVFQYMG